MPEVPRVGFNRWDQLVPAADRAGVCATVVVPFHERPAAVARVLAALAPQLGPDDRVVVVDDGSRPGLDVVEPPVGMSVEVVRRPDEGFALAAARNAGAAVGPATDVVVFLDDDMIPDPGWLEAHLRWHAAHDGLVTIGSRVHGPGEGVPPRHVASHLAWTNDLTAPTDDLFRICSGGNLGVRRAALERVGGFDETFRRYGVEDVEWGYRAVQRGCVLVPVAAARCRHEGPPGWEDPVKAEHNRRQRTWAADLIAHPSFRSTSPGRVYGRPLRRVLVPAALGVDLVEVVLSAWSDVGVALVGVEGPEVVGAEVVGAGVVGAEVVDAFRGDPRVEPVDGGPWAGWDPVVPVHVEVVGAGRPGRADLLALEAALRRGPVGVAHLVDDGGEVIARAWLTRAVERARWSRAEDPSAVLAEVEARWGARWVVASRPSSPPAIRSVEDDLSTIRAAMRRLPAPVVHGLANGIRGVVAARRRVVSRRAGRGRGGSAPR